MTITPSSQSITTVQARNVGITVNEGIGKPCFTVTGASVTLEPGATTGNTSVTIIPSGGFTGAVGLTAAVTSGPIGAQNPPTLSFGSTTPVNITGSGTATDLGDLHYGGEQ